MSTATSPILLKKAEVCQRLSISVRALEGKVKEGAFPPPVRLGKHVYWSELAVNAWKARMFGPQEAWRPR